MSLSFGVILFARHWYIFSVHSYLSSALSENCFFDKNFWIQYIIMIHLFFYENSVFSMNCYWYIKIDIWPMKYLWFQKIKLSQIYCIFLLKTIQNFFFVIKWQLHRCKRERKGKNVVKMLFMVIFLDKM